MNEWLDNWVAWMTEASWEGGGGGLSEEWVGEWVIDCEWLET